MIMVQDQNMFFLIKNVLFFIELVNFHNIINIFHDYQFNMNLNFQNFFLLQLNQFL